MDKNVEKLIEYLDDRMVIDQPLRVPPEYTLVFKPDVKLAKEIELFIDEARRIDDRHTYYKRENLHATIYAPINIDTDVEKLHSFLEKELHNKEISFDVGGVSSSVVAAKPVNFSLFDLRRRILNFLNDKERLNRAKELETMSWFNFVRFKAKPNNRYYDFIKKNHTKSFGQFKPKFLELYKTSSRILDSSAKIIFSIKLG